MIPSVSLPPLQTISAAPITPFMAETGSEAGIGHLPVVSVVAPVALPELYNNRQGKGAVKPANVQEAIAASEMLAAFAPGFQPPTEPEATGFAFSTPFLAQLLSQTGEAESGALASFFALPTPRFNILDVRTALEFANVKYLPSNAALPLPLPQAPVVIARSTAEAMPPAPLQEELVATTAFVRNLPPVQAAPAVGRAQTPLPPVAVPRSSATTERTGQELTGRGVSLVAAPGFSAYFSALSRNQANLNAPVDAPAVFRATL